MVDLTRHERQGETPVNPYSLLEAVNNSSHTAHTAWLIFLGVMAYLTIAVAGVTHKDLLLETPVSLPILQVDIQLRQFFQFAPVVLVLMHVGLVSQLALLARETLEFDAAIRLIEATDKRTHPLRLELNNFFFVQAIAGPHRSRVMSAFLYGMSWLTLVALPVLLGIFKRNLEVMDTNLVPGSAQRPGEASLNLRGRDLRFAKLDRSDLHQADFTGADLTGASLVGADLTGAWMQCADITRLVVAADRDGADCTRARRAIFTRARLEGAHLSGIDLTGAQLAEARLEGATLAYALMPGANFASARLDKADLSGGVEAQGANFLMASLQGVDLTGAQLLGADFSHADLIGAVMSFAALDLALLKDAKLDGAVLYRASLIGADVSGATTVGTDLREAKVWRTLPPATDPNGLADFTGVAIARIADGDAAEIKARLARVQSRRVRARLQEKAAAIVDFGESARWTSSAEYRQWQGLASAGTRWDAEIYRQSITEYLAQLVCRPRWSNGAVATGVARRAQRQEFRGDMVQVYTRLKAASCPASETVGPKVLRDLSTAVDVAHGG